MDSTFLFCIFFWYNQNRPNAHIDHLVNTISSYNSSLSHHPCTFLVDIASTWWCSFENIHSNISVYYSFNLFTSLFKITAVSTINSISCILPICLFFSSILTEFQYNHSLTQYHFLVFYSFVKDWTLSSFKYVCYYHKTKYC